MRATFRAVLATTFLTACATGAASGTRHSWPSLHDQVTLAEITPAFSTAYDVVETLRPEFLRPHAYSLLTMQAITPVVYIDGLRGDPSMLRTVPASSVYDIRYLRGIEASGRLGPGHEGGAIIVTTKMFLRPGWLSDR